VFVSGGGNQEGKVFKRRIIWVKLGGQATVGMGVVLFFRGWQGAASGKDNPKREGSFAM